MKMNEFRLDSPVRIIFLRAEGQQIIEQDSHFCPQEGLNVDGGIQLPKRAQGGKL